MVNAFHAMNLELMKSDTATDGEICLLRYTAVERQQLSARISHLLTGRFSLGARCFIILLTWFQ